MLQLVRILAAGSVRSWALQVGVHDSLRDIIRSTIERELVRASGSLVDRLEVY